MKDHVDSDDVISTREAAAILRVSPATVLRLYHKGVLPGYQVGQATSPLKLYRDGVFQFLEARKAASPAPANTPAPTRTETEVEEP